MRRQGGAQVGMVGSGRSEAEVTRDQPKFGKWPDEPNLYVLNRSRTEYRTVN